LWKLHDVVSSGFGAQNAAVSSTRNWSHAWMWPFGRFEYQCCAKPLRDRMRALTLQVGPPPVASTAASYLSRNSLGSESPSYCERMAGLKRGGH
jgi:hypothetical protein